MLGCFQILKLDPSVEWTGWMKRDYDIETYLTDGFARRQF